MKRLLLASLILGATAFGQTPVNVQLRQPDCSIYFTLTAASPNSVTFDNRQTGCTNWTVTYLNNGFAVLSLAIRGAPDNAGVPGVWANFAGTVLTGVNPNVGITQATTMMFGYAPWMRMAATVAGAGTITGRLYGYRQTTVSTFAGGIVPGGTFLTYSGCTTSRLFNLAGAGNTEIVPLVAGQVIRICHLSLSTVPSEDIYLSYGTGANCVVGPAALTGIYMSVTQMAMDWNGGIIAPVSQALCLNQSLAQATGGVVIYSQYVP
jgi:hypothetical protein